MLACGPEINVYTKDTYRKVARNLQNWSGGRCCPLTNPGASDSSTDPATKQKKQIFIRFTI
jgi:hypothetical protein